MSDPSNPSHYKDSTIEHWDVVEAWNLDYLLGNCTKYIARHMKKGTPLQDIDKAITYLVRYKKKLAAELEDTTIYFKPIPPKKS